MRGRAGGVGMCVDGSLCRKNLTGNNNVEEIVAVLSRYTNSSIAC